MLEIVNYGIDEYDFPCLLVLGCFDGLHIGHAELLKKAKLQAKINGLDLGVMMFADGKGGKYLYSFEERMRFLEQFNVKFVLKIDFTEEFKNIKPMDFLACIEDKLNLKAYMSGEDFRFGQGKKGKASTLKNYAEDEDNGVWYMTVKDVIYDDEKVSTTLIKSFLESGDVLRASELLGRNYSVSGKVIHGADRGGKIIGYPTMNIEWGKNKYEVKQGVYKVKCFVNGQEYYGIANYGSRPTFEEDAPVLEVYLKGYSGENYDEAVTVEFIDFIRDIVKFENAEQLGDQLSKDLRCLDEETEIAVDSDEVSDVKEQPKSDDELLDSVTECETAVAEELPAVELVATEEPANENNSVVLKEVTIGVDDSSYVEYVEDVSLEISAASEETVKAVETSEEVTSSVEDNPDDEIAEEISEEILELNETTITDETAEEITVEVSLSYEVIEETTTEPSELNNEVVTEISEDTTNIIEDSLSEDLVKDFTAAELEIYEETVAENSEEIIAVENNSEEINEEFTTNTTELSEETAAEVSEEKTAVAEDSISDDFVEELVAEAVATSEDSLMETEISKEEINEVNDNLTEEVITDNKEEIND